MAKDFGLWILNWNTWLSWWLCYNIVYRHCVWNHRHNKSRERAPEIEREIRTSLNSVSASIKLRGTGESSRGYWASVNTFKHAPSYRFIFQFKKNWPGEETFISFYRNRRAKKNEPRGFISEQRHPKNWSKYYHIWGTTQFRNLIRWGEPYLIWLILFLFTALGSAFSYQGGLRGIWYPHISCLMCFTSRLWINGHVHRASGWVRLKEPPQITWSNPSAQTGPPRASCQGQLGWDFRKLGLLRDTLSRAVGLEGDDL